MSWAQRLKRTFDLDVLSCEHCGAPMKLLHTVRDPQAIERILSHRQGLLRAQALDRQGPHGAGAVTLLGE